MKIFHKYHLNITQRDRKYKVLSAVPRNLLVRCFNESGSENIFRNTGHQHSQYGDSKPRLFIKARITEDKVLVRYLKGSSSLEMVQKSKAVCGQVGLKPSGCDCYLLNMSGRSSRDSWILLSFSSRQVNLSSMISCLKSIIKIS